MCSSLRLLSFKPSWMHTIIVPGRSRSDET
jgi:hypothetical protein